MTEPDAIGVLDIETHDGKVVAVWLGCLELPYRQQEVDDIRVAQLIRGGRDPNRTVRIQAVDLMPVNR